MKNFIRFILFSIAISFPNTSFSIGYELGNDIPEHLDCDSIFSMEEKNKLRCPSEDTAEAAKPKKESRRWINQNNGEKPQYADTAPQVLPRDSQVKPNRHQERVTAFKENRLRESLQNKGVPAPKVEQRVRDVFQK